jgi:hypothetical protein
MEKKDPPLIADEPTGVKFARFPVVSLSAEYLVMGHLLRRNILTYKAPPANEGYDLISIHPNPRKAARQLRIQVKSRMATDSDRGFPLKAKSIDAFDFLIVAFLNVGYYFSKAKRHAARDGACEPEFYTLTPDFLRAHHDQKSSWEKVRTRGLDLSSFKNELGFELIAQSLGVDYPSKAYNAFKRRRAKTHAR